MRSGLEARAFMEEPAFELGLVDAGAHCFSRTLVGKLPNEDTWVADGG